MILNPFDLQGKTCLITGASSGIGRSAAILVSECGGTVVATGRNEKRLNRTLNELSGNDHLIVPADLLDPDAICKIAENSPPLNGLVHCAGIVRPAPIRYTTDKIMQALSASNVNAPVALTRELLKRNKILSGGAILLLSSISGLRGGTGLVAYAASKAALIGMNHAMASELAVKQIRCNCLAPGMVRTPMIGEESEVNRLEKDERKYPFGYGNPEDVANAIVFFVSDGSRWITGQTLVLDGGFSL